MVLYVISEFQINRVRFQVNLCAEVWLAVFSGIVIDQCDRHDEGNKALTILLNDFKEFLLLIWSQLFLEISHQVVQHVGIFPRCGF